MTIEHFCLDLETKSKNKSMQEHAGLEPWRRRQGLAEIMSCDVCRPDGSIVQIVNDDQELFTYRLRSLLAEMKGKVVWAHNTLFDVAWMIADLQPNRCGSIPQEILDIQWRDTSLLMKWLMNGQLAENSRISYSLANLIRKFLPEHPDTQEFIKMKAEGHMPGQDTEYWLQRGTMDVKMTLALAMKYLGKVQVDMRQGLKTEFSCIVPVANSWINGFKINKKILDDNSVYYAQRKENVAKILNIDSSVFSSPKKLGVYLFDQLGLTPHSYTPAGGRGTSKGDLMWMEYKCRLNGRTDLADTLKLILEAKESTTIMSKYVKTVYEALEHTGDGYIYSSPRLFGTYTGRMTYSNTTTHKDYESEEKTKWKTSIAMHQIPRKAKRVREMIEPPEGYKVGEFDAAGQESRLMALRSRDSVMLDIFANDLNFHSMTGSSIIGMDYTKFEEERKKEHDEGYYTEARQRGKLANLSCNYRISGKSFSEQAFEKYEVMIDIPTGNHIVKTFQTKYRGVPTYWDDVVYDSRVAGYTQEFGGRRFKLSDWKEYKWMTEQSAISFPIQGAGASMKEIAISELHQKVPEFVFALDLHDASFGYMLNEHSEEIYKEAENVLNNIEYEKYWGFVPEIKLPYDGKMGKTFADVK